MVEVNEAYLGTHGGGLVFQAAHRLGDEGMPNLRHIAPTQFAIGIKRSIEIGDVHAGERFFERRFPALPFVDVRQPQDLLVLNFGNSKKIYFL